MTTDRLLIRRFRAADASALAAYRSDPQIARFQGWSAPVSVTDATALVEEFVRADPHAPGWFQYAMASRDTGALVGDIGVCLHDNRMQAEIGFTLAPAFQGRGLAAEGVGRILAHLFDERGLHRVSAECDARNAASARLLERLGFALEGIRPQYTWIKGEWTDDRLYGLLAAGWRANRA